MCVGSLDGKALEKLFINGVEEMLFLGVVADSHGNLFNGDIKVIQRSEKIIATERVCCEGIDDGLNFAGDDVAVDEVGVAKDGSENPLGQEVLDEHLLNCGLGEVWIDRLTAFLVEVGKGDRKLTVGLPFLFNAFCQALSKFSHLVFELRDGLLPFGDFWRTVFKEGLDVRLTSFAGSVRSTSITCWLSCQRIARCGVWKRILSLG